MCKGWKEVSVHLYECGYICLKMGIQKQPEAEHSINVCTGDYNREKLISQTLWLFVRI